MALVTDKMLFIHVPKTAGSYIRSFMPSLGLQCRESGQFEIEDHFSISQVLIAHPELGDRFSFGFVRHPVAWIASRYFYAVKTNFGEKMNRQTDAAAHWMASCWADDVDSFVDRCLERHPGIATRTMFTLLGLWTKNPVYFVGRTEKLHNDLIKSISLARERIIGNFLPTTPVNVSNPDQILPNSRLAQRICDTERPLMDRFYA
jgi:hypothetical protein